MNFLYRGWRTLIGALVGVVLIVVVVAVSKSGSGFVALLWIIYLIGALVYWLRRLTNRVSKPSHPSQNREVPRSQQAWTAAVNASTPPRQEPIHLPTLGDILMLTPLQFEQATRDFLTLLGFQNMHTVGGSGDLGADVVGQDRQGRSTIVQCKRYAPGSQVGTPIVQSFIGMMTVHHRAERGIVVTSATFSGPAIDLARQHGITLIDGGALLMILGLTGMALVSQALPTSYATTSFSRPGLHPVNQVIDDFQRTNHPAMPRAASALRCLSCGIVQANAGMPFCAECGTRLRS